MGVATRLIISSRWKLEDVQGVLEHHQGIKSKLHSCCKIASDYVVIECENGRDISCFMNSKSTTGPTTHLSLRSNPEAIKMLKSIASVLGGFLNKEDFNETYEHISGYFDEEDGLPYHYKYAAIHNEIGNNDDLTGLKQSISDWDKRYKQRL